jgi:hypothetical protein
MADLIKERLRGRQKGTPIKPNPAPIINPAVQTANPLPDPNTKEANLADRLLVEYFLTHLDRKKAESYLTNPSSELRKRLILADAYAAEFGDTKLYKFIEDSVNINSWTALLAQTLQKRLYDFATRLYREPEPVRKNMSQEIACNIVNQFIELDFSGYQERTKISEQNLVLLCDHILRIKPAFKEVGELRGRIKEKTRYLTDLIRSYSIDIGKEGLNALYLLDGIRELK